MKNSIIFLTLFSGLILTACDRPAADKSTQTVVVPVPTTTPAPVVVPMPVPGPAGAPGPAGQSGDKGVKGDPGKTGGDTVIIVPPAEPTKPEVVQPAN